ncbi:MAG TPA: hypothetical protein VHR97_01665 [Candidatus Baltobacteraceae bacterium]|jgi:hypothetical protein|nr:hypothetical protein [Candidatus Baltobacteraceae bacterium]
MAVTSSQVAPLTELPTIHASFRRKHGIPPKGKPPAGGWADSDYGYPLPPSDHPQAYKFARAVVSRAHQNTKFDPDQLAKQVRRAQTIIAKHEKNGGAK